MKKVLALALAFLLLPLGTQAADQIVPTGVARMGTGFLTMPPGQQANVAIVDTGIDPTHPDLNVVGGVDCSPEPKFASPLTFTTQDVKIDSPFGNVELDPNAPGWADGMGHGTHVAGIIGAKDNGLGVVGVAPGANLYAVRVLDAGGSGDADSLLCGLRWIAREHERIHFDVVNMSLGFHFNPTVVDGREMPPLISPCYTNLGEPFITEPFVLDIRDAICDLTGLGIPVVVAAGNDEGSASYNFPALLDNVITVSNYSDFDGLPGGLSENVECPDLGGRDDSLWTHWNGTPQKGMSSSNGPDVDIAAPGTCILSTMPGPWGIHGGAYGTATGTSMAAPHVTGLVARYKAIYHDAPNNEVRKWLLASAEEQTDAFGDTDSFPEPLAHWGAPTEPARMMWQTQNHTWK